jgi:PPP family 3-phenylpropionic acid transporter
MLFHTAIQPQLEVLTQSIVRKSPKLYARIRLWGSLGFVTVAVLSGIFIEVNVRDFYLISGTTILIFLLFISFLLPQPRVRRNTGKTLVKIRYKLLHKHFVAFFIAGLLLQMSFGPYYSFFALYLRDLGYPSYSVGLFLGLSVFAEIIIFMLAGKLFRHLTIKIALMSSLLLTAIRWFFMAEFAEYMLFIILAQLLHAASFGINHSASMLFLQQHFEPSHQSRAQAIYVGGIYGLGGALGAWISGILWQQGDGASLTFYLAGMTSMVACLVIAISANTQISK